MTRHVRAGARYGDQRPHRITAENHTTCDPSVVPRIGAWLTDLAVLVHTRWCPRCWRTP